jgi:hypothetical protein
MQTQLEFGNLKAEKKKYKFCNISILQVMMKSIIKQDNLNTFILFLIGQTTQIK